MHMIFGAAGEKSDERWRWNCGARRCRYARSCANAAQGDALARLGCEIAVADLHDVASLDRALDGARMVQVLIPLPRDPHPADTMRTTIEVTARALAAHREAHVLAISDYGAELDAGTGITMLFHHFEAALRDVSTKLTLLRSAEHMQNWLRVLPVALSSGGAAEFS